MWVEFSRHRPSSSSIRHRGQRADGAHSENTPVSLKRQRVLIPFGGIERGKLPASSRTFETNTFSGATRAELLESVHCRFQSGEAATSRTTKRICVGAPTRRTTNVTPSSVYPAAKNLQSTAIVSRTRGFLSNTRRRGPLQRRFAQKTLEVLSTASAFSSSRESLAGVRSPNTCRERTHIAFPTALS